MERSQRVKRRTPPVFACDAESTQSCERSRLSDTGGRASRRIGRGDFGFKLVRCCRRNKMLNESAFQTQFPYCLANRITASTLQPTLFCPGPRDLGAAIVFMRVHKNLADRIANSLMPNTSGTGRTVTPVVVARRGARQYTARHFSRECIAIFLDSGVLRSDSFAKDAVAFFGISRSNSA